MTTNNDAFDLRKANETIIALREQLRQAEKQVELKQAEINILRDTIQELRKEYEK